MDHQPEPCVMVIFGATGDLTRRKLIPALYNLQRDGLLPEKFAVCAYARRPMDDKSFVQHVAEELSRFSRQRPGEDWEKLAKRIHYVKGDLDEEAGFQRLKEKLNQIDAALGTAGNRLFYLAIGPEHFAEIVERLSKNGLMRRAKFGVANPGPWQRVVIEKPIGHDLNSARALLSSIADYASETQVFRIDHYLGKETVQNLLALRFGNCIFEPLWNRNYIDHVQITVAESEGVGTRAGYYDNAGVLRDVVQNHVLQLLCLVAMETPGTMNAEDIRNEKVKVLHNLRKMTAQDVARHTVRGQYGPSPDGKQVAYRHEKGVAPTSITETYVALRCFVDNWRWADVPFLLRAGKCMTRRQTEISIHFRVPPLQLFGGQADLSNCWGNVLTISVQPNEGWSLQMAAKVPASKMRLKNVEMDFRYDRVFGGQNPEAYERLLLDVMGGDGTLFTRADEVEAQWNFIDSVVAGWQTQPAPRFPNYFAGTWGPDESHKLVPACAHGWHMESKAN